jgi:hypothetical protein
MLPRIRPRISIAVLCGAQKGLVRHQNPTSLPKVQMKSCTDFPRRLSTYTTVNRQDGHRLQRLIRHCPHATVITIDGRHSRRNACPHRYAPSRLNPRSSTLCVRGHPVHSTQAGHDIYGLSTALLLCNVPLDASRRQAPWLAGARRRLKSANSWSANSTQSEWIRSVSTWGCKFVSGRRFFGQKQKSASRLGACRGRYM